ncbi:hypothetical protein [Arthrobacter sp. AL12]|uniref:hypothetical protein n=1 Tax=Arthrobacter sp. AL12 TaxID=3042241 RepID=UPI002499C276|nr:hypothetical protein [Arthrobacter sp. AL12]MDI3211704.1 hypothetical protein [Arthrobacter sp. AL12]
MSYNAHPDDQPSAQWRRFAADDEAETVMPEFSFQDPVAVGMMFCNALDDPKEYHVALSRLATPESLLAFGDFAEASAFLASIEDPGYGSQVNRAHGDDDVAYFKILAGTTDSFQALEDQVLPFAAVVTLVWRPEFGEWRVHGIGNYIRPEDVPH